jgi:hypothetical protein
MKTIIKRKSLLLLLFAVVFLSSYKLPESSPAFTSYILTKVKIECITQCDATGSDQVYVTIPVQSINHKTSLTRSFKPGNVKAYTEIGPNSGSATTAWFVKQGERIRIFENDLVDPDDLIKEITVTTANSNGQPQVVTGINGKGKYKITFTIAVI